MTAAGFASQVAPYAPAALALTASLLLRGVHPRRPGAAGVVAALVSWLSLSPLALVVAGAAQAPWLASPAVAGLGVAVALGLVARDTRDRLQSECALKLLWVFGAAFALSWTGESLLVLASGTAVVREQWPALALGLDPYALWSAALSLSLVAGLVLLGGAPFHFWLADLFHGARAWLAPLVAAALQILGAAWILRRIDGIASFPTGATLTGSLLTLAAGVAFAAGAATLASQRRPERRVGTLASLQGALLLAALIARGSRSGAALSPWLLPAWSAHLALSLTAAGALARFLPVPAGVASPPAALFRRHPWTGLAAAFALLSLAGTPLTPGFSLWLHVAQRLAAGRHAGLLFLLIAAWVTALAVASAELRRAFGAPSSAPPPAHAVPWPARAAMWAAGLGVLAVWWSWW